MANVAAINYFGDITEGFARQADVLLVVDDLELPAHSQYLSSHSRVLEQLLDTADVSFSSSNPLRLQAPLERHA